MVFLTLFGLERQHSADGSQEYFYEKKTALLSEWVNRMHRPGSTTNDHSFGWFTDSELFVGVEVVLILSLTSSGHARHSS